MLWEVGRLLLGAFRMAASGVRRRALPFLRVRIRGAGGARHVASGAALALLTSLVILSHPGGSSDTERPRGPASTFDLAEGDAVDLGGSASVSVSGASHLSPGTAPAVVPDERHALLVGINTAPGASPLEGAVTDALNVKQALLAYGFPAGNITTLLDSQASRDAILQGLDDLARRTPASGIAVVVFAAHSRRHDGVDQLLAGDGARINSTEIAGHLQHLRSRAWIALPTCYAGGYALPGIVGHNRIATFASSADQESYELGSAGSYLIIDMVREAMIERRAPYSVEAAFNWAQQTLERTHPNRVPSMSDGIPGDLVLGEMAGMTDEAPPSPPHPRGTNVYEAQPPGRGDPQPQQPEPSPSDGRRYSVTVCSNRANVNCSSP